MKQDEFVDKVKLAMLEIKRKGYLTVGEELFLQALIEASGVKCQIDNGHITLERDSDLDGVSAYDFIVDYVKAHGWVD